MTQLSWIGLGNMGRGMAANIAKKGNLSSPLLIHNRTQKRADDLNAALGGSVRVAPTVAEAVAPADVVFTCVGDDAAILDTFRAVVAAGVRGKLLVDCSTVHPDTTMELERMARDGGARFVAMPVFGAPAAADAGQLVCVVAGPKADIETVKPYTTGVMGKALIDLSDAPPSKALTLKLLGNTFVLSLIETLAEGHVLAEKCGLGTGPLDAFVQAMLPGPFATYSTRMLSGDYYTRAEPLFAVDLARKDARHAMDLANKAGAPLRIVPVVDENLVIVKEIAGEKGDIAGVYGAVRHKHGLPYQN